MMEDLYTSQQDYLTYCSIRDHLNSCTDSELSDIITRFENLPFLTKAWYFIGNFGYFEYTEAKAILNESVKL